MINTIKIIFHHIALLPESKDKEVTKREFARWVKSQSHESIKVRIE